MHNAPRPGTANAGPKLNETGSPEAVFFSRIAEPDQLAPSWLPRQQRRHVDRQLRRLLRRDVCSICGNTFKHNSRTAAGFDARGNVVLAGECCIDRVAQIFWAGVYSTRHYDFLPPAKPRNELTGEEIADAIAASQKTIAATDQALADLERRGGGVRAPNIVTRNPPWKTDDASWFKRNQSRTHRVRMPFPGEVNEEVTKTAAERALVMLVRQVAPGSRLRAVVDLSADLLPVPDDEAVAHTMFEIAMQREADGETLRTLIKKYQANGTAS
jgi:hypothetical protein